MLHICSALAERYTYILYVIRIPIKLFDTMEVLLYSFTHVLETFNTEASTVKTTAAGSKNYMENNGQNHTVHLKKAFISYVIFSANRFLPKPVVFFTDYKLGVTTAVK